MDSSRLPENSNLAWAFVNNAHAYLNSDAVVSGSRRITYAELLGNVGWIKDYLIEHEIKKGARVAIYLSNSPEYIALFYGVLAAGGTVVPLNTSAKSRDINNWVRHSGVDWFFFDGRSRDARTTIPELGKKIRCVGVGSADSNGSGWFDSIDTILADPKSSLDVVSVGNRDLAMIIYTSGTTGMPKGVSLSHGNLKSNFSAIIKGLELSASDRILSVLPFYYSYGNSVLNTHLLTGGCLVLENSMMYPQLIVDKFDQENITGFYGVPSTYAILLKRTNLKETNFSSFRLLAQAGGPMPPAHINELTKLIGETDFYVMYGQTEASARLTILDAGSLNNKLGSIGKAVDGVTIEVRNKDGQPVESGVTGELCAFGKNIMPGYWRDKSLTGSAVVDGWLHTGDLGHADDDGFLYIDGRTSDMIKSGANRISPKEIEEVIAELRDIAEVAVVGIPDELMGEVIEAFIVLAPGTELDQRVIQSYCLKNLASYKVPKKITFIDELQKTQSGKVMRYLLKAS
ncbi:MAG: acyl--CoA ligase [gamma proteobacterium endosymbiont of Lamellibrachia anaximandri]|nr:acyl--CoA ligase [gamma proteobacterium endosymbiont of Lamellibrachia anaximandri]MBL3534656.1 acyl--CoA ligase [gamma proteobacterium endosymbiont of Lamellibrachia anaximandri]